MKKLLTFLIVSLSFVLLSCSEKDTPQEELKKIETSSIDSTIFEDGIVFGKRYIFRLNGFISEEAAQEMILARVDVDKTVKFQTSEAKIVTPSKIKYIVSCTDSLRTAYKYTWENNTLTKEQN